MVEIQRYVMNRGLSAYDRPDITSRLFHVKLGQMMDDLKKGHFFGKVNASAIYLFSYLCYFLYVNYNSV